MSTDSSESRTDRLLGLKMVTRAMATSTPRHVRILAYHGVPHAELFRAHLQAISDDYHPVTGSELQDALHHGKDLPPRPVWVTFDDGRTDVVEAGMAELDRFGIKATMFVCPGLIIDSKPFWWDVVQHAVDSEPFEFAGRRWSDRSLITALKGIPDQERREVVAELEHRTKVAGTPMDSSTILRPDHLRTWMDAGHEIGNHTWDHPCLDQCSDEEQQHQVHRAHTALTEMTGHAPTMFAYPNGDWAPSAESELVRCDYKVGLLFDHHLSKVSQNPLRLSRLRIDSDAPKRRRDAILSGAHSATFGAKRAIGKLRGGAHV